MKRLAMLLPLVLLLGCALSQDPEPYAIKDQPKPDTIVQVDPEKPEDPAPPEEQTPEDLVEKYQVTVYTASWCGPCQSVKRRDGDGNQFIHLAYAQSAPPDGIPEVYPTYYWKDSAGQAFYLQGDHTLEQLKKKIETNGIQRAAAVGARNKQQKKSMFSLPYAREAERFIEEWEKNLGDGTSVTVVLDRSGAQTATILGGNRPTWQELVGNFGHLQVSTDAAFEIQNVGVTYRLTKNANGGDVVELAMDKLIYDLSERRQVAGVGAQKVGVFPIMSLISIGYGIWELCHPHLDIAIPGTLKLKATLKNQMVTVEFETEPKVNFKAWFIQFAPSVSKIEITKESARLIFSGSVIKERTFQLTEPVASAALLNSSVASAGTATGFGYHTHTCYHRGTSHRREPPYTWGHYHDSFEQVDHHLCAICGNLVSKKDI